MSTAQSASGDPMLPRPARVVRRRRDGPDVWTLELDTPLLPFVPGQFNMLSVAGVGEIPISLSGDGAIGGAPMHTVRAVGPVSKALTTLRPGAALGVRGPFGFGWPMAEATGRDVAIIAGGLGLAPLRPALCALLDRPRGERRLILLYGARSPETLLFRRDIERWRRRGVEVELTVDHAERDWSGHVGVVPDLIAAAKLDPARTLSFVCGPEVMMRFSVAALLAQGMAETSIYLSLERNMNCGVGHCGHCQLGRHILCRDGPVLRYDAVRAELNHREL